MAQRIVRIDGVEHRFPDDFTDDEISQALSGSATPDPARERMNLKIAAEQTPMSPEKVAKSKEAGMGMLPAVGGTLAALATGGASLPITAGAAALGGAAGQLAKDSQWDMPASERAKNAALSAGGQAIAVGAVPKALQAAAAGVRSVGGALQRGGRNLWTRVAKIGDAPAKATNTARQGGSLKAAKDEIADTVLGRGLGTLREGNADALKAAADDTEAALSSAISNSTATVDPRKAVLAGMRQAAREKRGFGTGQQYQAARNVVEEARQALTHPTKRTIVEAKYPNAVRPSTIVDTNDANAVPREFSPLQWRREAGPRAWNRVPVQKAQADKVATYQNMSYGADASSTAANRVRKEMARNYKDQIAAAEPAAAAANAELSKLYPAGEAYNNAMKRIVNRDPVQFSQMAFGIGRDPITGLGAIMNTPTAGSFAAQRLYNLGKRGASVAVSNEEALRAAILANLMASHK